MRNLSVKEVADVLGISNRAVLKRLNNDQLRGTRRTNKFGVEEWWVYPNKEIRSALEAAGKIDLFEIQTDASAEETESIQVDAYETEAVGEDDPDDRWYVDERAKVRLIAEEVVKPLTERLEQQARALEEKDRIIEEKDRQLRLLPDLQKQAEEERNAMELRSLEAEALKKQIAAMESEREEAELSRKKAEELETALAQLQSEKAAKEQIIEEQLAALQAQLEKLQKPWWKRVFGGAGVVKAPK